MNYEEYVDSLQTLLFNNIEGDYAFAYLDKTNGQLILA
jgi:asparagine synthetase B (glutamine-hydrolysing)